MEYIQNRINKFYDEEQLLRIYKKDRIVNAEYNLYKDKMLDCDNNLDLFNDTLLSLMIEEGIMSRDTYKAICKDYDILNIGIDQLLSDIIYNYQSILHAYRFSNKTYSRVQKIFEDGQPLNKISIFVLMIFRPIQTFIKGTINKDIIDDSKNNYMTFTFIYLTLNVIVDMVLCFLIYEMILKKASNISRYYSSLVNALKV